MSLIANDLGDLLNNASQKFNDKDISDIVSARKDYWRAIAKEIVEYFKANAVVRVPGAGLIAPSGGGAVTGQSITGKII